MEDDMTRNMIMAGAFYTVMIGIGIWQVLRLISKGGLSNATGLVRLAATLVILGIMCWVGFTMLKVWTA